MAKPTIQFVAEYEFFHDLIKQHFLYPLCLLKTQTDIK